MSRRKLLAHRLSKRSSAVCVILLAAGVCARGAEVVKVRMDPGVVLGRISEDFIGLGYETSAVAQSNFFSAQNAGMIQLYRNLSPHGLIRIGGNVSDHTRYVPDGAPAARTERETTIINRANLSDLAEFAHATGWKVMWGLNLGTGSTEEAVEEAVAVDAALGTNLHSFQIGNEVDGLRRFAKDYAAYHRAFLDYKAAIRAALPAAVFSGPDVIGNWNWITNFVSAEAGDMKLLTQHYYRGGAHDPASTLDKLLKPDVAFDGRLQKLRELCRDKGLFYRINEVNSFYGGGKPNVSDTFASALWALDFMFRLASHGCEGINLETDRNQLGFISYYSPIGRDSTGRGVARPEYYGMLAFSLCGNGDVLQVTQDKTDINLPVYATRNAKRDVWIVIVNKDASRDAILEMPTPKGYAPAGLARLTARSLESKDHVTLAGAEVSGDGKWKPGPLESCAEKDGMVRIKAPHGSAVLAEFSIK